MKEVVNCTGSNAIRRERAINRYREIWEIIKPDRNNLMPIETMARQIPDISPAIITKCMQLHMTSGLYNQYIELSNQARRANNRKISTSEYGPKIMEAINQEKLPKTVIQNNLGLKPEEFERVFIEFNSDINKNGEPDLSTGQKRYKEFIKNTNKTNTLFQEYKEIIPIIGELFKIKGIKAKEIYTRPDINISRTIFNKIKKNFFQDSPPITYYEKRRKYIPQIMELYSKNVTINAMKSKYNIPLSWVTIDSLIKKMNSRKQKFEIKKNQYKKRFEKNNLDYKLPKKITDLIIKIRNIKSLHKDSKQLIDKLIYQCRSQKISPEIIKIILKATNTK